MFDLYLERTDGDVLPLNFSVLGHQRFLADCQEVKLFLRKEERILHLTVADVRRGPSKYKVIAGDKLVGMLTERSRYKIFQVQLPDEPKPWVELLKKLRSIRNVPPVLGVGKEKATVFCPYEPNKAYVSKECFEAVSNLEINKRSEIFITIDNHPAPPRWSEKGLTSQGRLERRLKVAEVENIGRQRAIENGSAYLMMVESDLLPPRDAYRRLRTLIVKYGADIAFLPYTWHWINPEKGPYRKSAPLMAWMGRYPNMGPIILQRFLTRKYPQKVTTSGFGCTMFTKRVFKEPFETDPDSVWSPDGVMARRVNKEKLKVLCDNRVVVQHICCVNCYGKAFGAANSKPVNVREKINSLFKGRVVVKEV